MKKKCSSCGCDLKTQTQKSIGFCLPCFLIKEKEMKKEIIEYSCDFCGDVAEHIQQPVSTTIIYHTYASLGSIHVDICRSCHHDILFGCQVITDGDDFYLKDNSTEARIDIIKVLSNIDKDKKFTKVWTTQEVIDVIHKLGPCNYPIKLNDVTKLSISLAKLKLEKK